MSLKRILKWLLKTEPDIMDMTYRLSRDIMIDKAVEFQMKHQADVVKVRNFVETIISNPFMKMPYISYGQRIAKIASKYKGPTAVKAAVGEAMLWRQRGLEDFLLIEIPKLFNLDITHEYMMAMSQVAVFMTIPHEYTVTVEETEVPTTLIEFADTRAQGVEGYIKLTQMGEDDIVEVAEYIKLTPETNFHPLNIQEIDVNKLDANILRFPLKIVRYGYRLTLTSKTYAPRTITVSFNRVIYSR
ncbi:MAG: hypothetical protein QW290_08580 [Sulfolobales archaeon]